MINLQNIAVACARECLRQRVGIDRLGLLLEAYAYATKKARKGLPDISDLIYMAKLLEPDNHGVFRHIPVTFQSGGTAADPSVIAMAVDRLFNHIDGDATTEEWVKAFLDIHPFTDGNGRTAFILYNWLKQSLEDPVALPDFYQTTAHEEHPTYDYR